MLSLKIWNPISHLKTQSGSVICLILWTVSRFLFPSTSETFGNVTLEAMACGLPVIAFDYGAAREHIVDGECGMGIPIGDEAAFVSAARQLASAPSSRARMGRAARAAVSGLSPDSVNLHFSELLQSLVMEAAA